jgi:hypothetical protein
LEGSVAPVNDPVIVSLSNGISDGGHSVSPFAEAAASPSPAVGSVIGRGILPVCEEIMSLIDEIVLFIVFQPKGNESNSGFIWRKTTSQVDKQLFRIKAMDEERQEFICV